MAGALNECLTPLEAYARPVPAEAAAGSVPTVYAALPQAAPAAPVEGFGVAAWLAAGPERVAGAAVTPAAAAGGAAALWAAAGVGAPGAAAPWRAAARCSQV